MILTVRHYDRRALARSGDRECYGSETVPARLETVVSGVCRECSMVIPIVFEKRARPLPPPSF